VKRDRTEAGFWRRYISLMDRECSRPHDRIYAIRSCLGLDHLYTLRPDYSLSKLELYREATLTLLGRRRGYADEEDHHRDGHEGLGAPWLVLLLATTCDRTALDPAWPSWIPDLHHLTTESRLVMDRFALVRRANSHDSSVKDIGRFHSDIRDTGRF
jgi:hypothetical protein